MGDSPKDTYFFHLKLNLKKPKQQKLKSKAGATDVMLLNLQYNSSQPHFPSSVGFFMGFVCLA